METQVRVLKYPFIVTNFRSSLDLDSVCTLLSERLFGGAAFRPSRARDEVPCRALAEGVLGMRVLVYGRGGEDGYQLWMEPIFAADFPVGPLDREPVRLDEYLFHLLGSIEHVKPLPHDFTEEKLTPEQLAELRELSRQGEETARRIREDLKHRGAP